MGRFWPKADRQRLLKLLGIQAQFKSLIGTLNLATQMSNRRTISSVRVFGIGLSICSALLFGQESSTEIVPAGSQLEILFKGGFFLEGPAHSSDGNIYFSDVTYKPDSGFQQGGHIWRYDSTSKNTTIFRSPSGMANGIIFDLDGNMLIAQGADFGGRSVVRVDMSTGKSTIIAGLFNGKSFNAPNDLAIDEAGRIYFTDPWYFGHEPVEQPVMGVYRIDTDGRVSLIIDDAGKPNGIVVSPDQQTLYVASADDPSSASALNALLAYDLSGDGGASNRRVLVDFGAEWGPDGMTIDTDGNLYLARSSEDPGIHVYSPDGKLQAFIPTPMYPSNVTFGHGPFSQTLFITAQQNLYRIDVSREGYRPTRN